MPTADAVIAWQNIERRALDLHAAGAEGTTGQLHLDFLLGRATPGQGAYQDAHDDADESAYSDAQSDADESACSDTHAEVGEGACEDAQTGGRGGGRGGSVVNPVLVVPWDPSLGRPSGPAELPGFGLLDEQDTIDLLAAAGDNPANRWCLTVQGGRRTLDTSADTAADLAARLGIHLTPITTGACQRAHAEPRYKLRHLIQARNTRCATPGCGRPTARSARR